MEIPSFNALIQQSIIDHWDMDALTDYKGATLQYHDVARKIEKLHIMFENSGVVKGDKIALCGRNSANWAVAFLATLTYGAIAVPILHEFMPEQIHNIVNHSDAKLLFVGDVVATQVDATKMPGLEGIIYIPDYSLVVSRTDKLTYAREHLNEMFGIKYPKYFRKNHVNYYIDQDPNELAMINYTSGTTGFSKGVMVPYRALWSNADFAENVLGKKIKAGDSVISILPMAHMYGMSFEFIFEFIKGCHIFYLTRIPSPAIIAEAFLIKPNNHELGEIFGVTLKTREEVIPYGRKLQEKGARNVLISMAGEGAVLIAENGEVYSSPAPKGTLVNGVGAGDSMVAGFMAGWMEKQDYEHAFHMGVATGSASAFSEYLATRPEVEEVYKQLV